jgi:hypothetical protein
METMRLAIFNNYEDARRIAQLLANANLEPELHGELGLAKLWFVPKREAVIRVEVPRRHARRSRDFLLQLDHPDGLLRGAIRCPDCRSLRVTYPQFTEKSLFTNLIMGVLVELRFLQREFYCEDCHCMWARPDRKPARTRAHMAPDYFIEGARAGVAPARSGDV